MCNEHNFNRSFGHGCFPFATKDISTMMQIGERFARHFIGRCGNSVPYNLEELADEYLITIPLSGRTKEDVKISLIGNNLNITAKKPKTEEKTKDASEKRADQFSWYFFKFIDVNLDIPLPANADENAIKSIMSNGLLRIKIGKKPSKTININDEGNN